MKPAYGKYPTFTEDLLFWLALIACAIALLWAISSRLAGG